MKKILFVILSIGLSTVFAKTEVKSERKPNQESARVVLITKGEKIDYQLIVNKMKELSTRTGHIDDRRGALISCSSPMDEVQECILVPEN